MLRRALWLAPAVLLACVASASGQYFGRNKVQYDDIDFRVLATTHFDIYYYESEQEMAGHAARMAERWHDRLSAALQHTMSARTPIVLYASHADFAHTTVTPGVMPEGVGGFTDHLKGRVVLPFAASLRETDHVLGHELVHAFQRDIVQKQGRSMASLPLWFLEGMAEHLSLGELDANTAMWIRDAAASNQLPTIAQLNDPRWFPYRFGQSLWAFLAATHGDDLPARALKSRARGGAVGRLADTTGRSSAELSRQWHAAIRETVAGGGLGSGPEPNQKVLIDRRSGGRLNLGPSLSADGRYVVFLSERDQYSVDVFLGDGHDGRVVRKLLTLAGTGQFEGLQFMESSGAWRADSTAYVLPALQAGRPVLTFIDMPGGSVRRVRPFEGLDHIYDPAWSPDGARVAFAALHNGRTDLYVLELATDSVRQLTDDAFADLQPAWSPDSTTLAFTSDRFTAALDDLTFGDYRLAALDVESGDIRQLPSIEGAKNIDPQWVGDDVFFVSDPGGVSNVFRTVPATGEITQVTSVPTGVSGMTALSPALSVAAVAEQMAFSVYRGGAYEIRSMPIATGREFAASPLEPRSAAVPAPAAEGFETKAYRPALGLNQISQPYMTAGGGALGGFFRAGVSISFSDLLEQQQVHTAVQVGSAFRDFAFQTAYVNRQARWTWGIAGGQLPVAFTRSRLTYGTGAEPIVRERTTLSQTHRQLTAMAAYPFNRFRRVEMSAGVHRIGFARDITTGLYARDTGTLIDEYDTRGQAASPMTLLETSAALVHDTSVHGANGPVIGGRARFDVSPTLGEIDFLTLTADYRRYYMPIAPLTVAVRLQHVGRYGPGAGDPRLLPLAWTVRDLVRGFSTRDAAPPACPAGSVATCDALSDFTARRLAVANLEVRLPLVGPVGRISRAAMLPIDAIAFADAGAFWSRRADVAESPVARALRSVGAGVRVNAGGFVLELAAARPLGIAGRGWTVAVNFRPGF